MSYLKTIKQFKGGSLSSTKLIQDHNNGLFVRKSVSLIENREYGFQRWYSQLKRLQRYAVLFPGFFPKLLNYGQDSNMAYFDIEYYSEAINAHTYLFNSKNSHCIDNFFDDLIKLLSKLHSRAMLSSESAMSLYFNEEILQRLNDCKRNDQFMKFIQYDEIIFNGQRIQSFISCLDEYKTMCMKFFRNPKETFTHGNLTLENILYIPSQRKVILIDPYEENIIDSELAELSQLLQSSNSKYEIYNNLEANMQDNVITLYIKENYGINYFNEKLLNYIKNQYSFDDYVVVRLLEISQFIRMLPFKMEVSPNKMYFFYGLASFLWHSLKQDINKRYS